MGRDQIFFGQQLDDIGQRLEQTVGSHARGAHPQLDVSNDFALHPLQVRQGGHQHGRDHHGLDDAQCDEIHLGP